MNPHHLDQVPAPEYEPPIEMIAGLEVSPETDIPFGKHFQMGHYEYVIYESATERGYETGVAAHLKFMEDQGDCPPAMLDDKQFTMILDAFIPKEISARDQVVWRAHFIAGWSSVFLGLVRD